MAPARQKTQVEQASIANGKTMFANSSSLVSMMVFPNARESQVLREMVHISRTQADMYVKGRG